MGFDDLLHQLQESATGMQESATGIVECGADILKMVDIPKVDDIDFEGIIKAIEDTNQCLEELNKIRDNLEKLTRR